MKKAIWLVVFAMGGILTSSILNACHATQVVGIGGKCLDVTRGGTTNGTNVEIWTCGAGYPNQRWTITGNSVVGFGGKCLDVDSGHTANGTGVHMLWDCKPGSANQRWQIIDGQLVGIGHKCLDVAGSNTDNGTPVILWDCHGGLNQKWSYLPSVIAR